MSYKYTVILLRPHINEADHDVPFGQDTYVANVTASSAMSAVTQAQHELFAADIENDMAPTISTDYMCVMVFEGWPAVALHGWQT